MSPPLSLPLPCHSVAGLPGEQTVALGSGELAHTVPGAVLADFLALKGLAGAERESALEAALPAAGMAVEGEHLVLPNGARLPLRSPLGWLVASDVAAVVTSPGRARAGLAQGVVVSVQAAADEFGQESPEAAGVAEALRRAVRTAGAATPTPVVVISALDEAAPRGAHALAQWRERVREVEGALGAQQRRALKVRDRPIAVDAPGR